MEDSELGPRTLRRIEFAKKHITDKVGKKWTDKGRTWVREIWAALDGYQTWPVDPAHLCDKCAQRVRQIVSQPDAVRNTKRKHAGGCKGLDAIKVIAVVGALDRRAGKTYNSAAFCHSEIFETAYQTIGYFCPAASQAEDLVAQNFTGPIERSKALSRRATFRGNKITVKRTKSSFQWFEHSDRSVTGRGLTALIIDECRDVHPATAAKAIPSVFDALGSECPKCPWRIAGATRRRTCPTCHARLRHWTGRLLLLSSKGRLTGRADRDWFANMVKKLRDEPHPAWVLWENVEKLELNPDVAAAGVKSAVAEALGDVEGIGEYIEGEIRNEFIEPGQEFIPEAALNRVFDGKLKNSHGTTELGFAFLDTAKSLDIINLVIVCQDSEKLEPGEHPWRRLYVPLVKIWETESLQTRGVVDEERMIDELDWILPNFMGVSEVMVDLRGGMAWAERMIARAQAGRGAVSWGRRLTGITKSMSRERDVGWRVLYESINTSEPTIRLPDLARYRAEFKGVEWLKRGDGTQTVVDKARHVRHKEITESTALCLWRIQEEIVQGGRTTLADVEGRSQKRPPGRHLSDRSRVLSGIFGSSGGRLSADDF